MLFINREDAGRRLARALLHYQDQPVVVYGLVRGGVILAAEIARILHAPLDILIPRKIGHPLQPEYAIGAVAEDGHTVLGHDTDVDPSWLEREIARQRTEAKRRREKYWGGRKPVPVEGKTAILIDDGIATGLTMKLAIKEVRHQHPHRIVVAVPVIPEDTACWLEQEVEEVVALEIPDYFQGAVGAYYLNFDPVEDDEVVRVINEAAKLLPPAEAPGDPTGGMSEPVRNHIFISR